MNKVEVENWRPTSGSDLRIKISYDIKNLRKQFGIMESEKATTITTTALRQQGKPQ